MSSRLDRLFILLESGGSAVTRRAAAKQLGDVVKGQEADSAEVGALLLRIIRLLYSKSWDTRVAAAAAIGAVLDNIPVWNPKPASQLGGGNIQSEGAQYLCVDLKAGSETIDTVLLRGRPLGADQDVAAKVEHKQDSTVDVGAQLHRERHLVNQKLGLNAAESLGFDTSAIFSNDDLLTPATPSPSHSGQTNAAVLLSEMTSDPANIITGKRTLAQEGAPCKRRRHSSEQQEQKPSEQDSVDTSFDIKPSPGPTANDGEWPLAWLCAELLRDTLSSCWETRHGAATALRELLARHGGDGGKRDHDTPQQLSEGHQRWVWAVSVRLVCVLALDTFGDYLADQVVAPVRETVAQALGVACVQLWPPHACGVASLLGQLVAWRGSWTARHGGLLGLKYTLAARRDILPKLLKAAYNNIYAGLLDDTDDVVGVAAECLTVCCSTAPVESVTDVAPPSSARVGGTETETSTVLKQETNDAAAGDGGSEDLDTSMVMVIDLEENAEEDKGDAVEDEVLNSTACSSLLQWMSEEQLRQLLATVWRSLLHVDDLSASTPALLLLLASLVKLHPRQQGWCHDSLRELVPRLFPFLQHSSSCVRRSALTTLAALTDPTSRGVPANTVVNDCPSSTEKCSYSLQPQSAHVQTNERTIIRITDGLSASPVSSKENGATTITTSSPANDHQTNCDASSDAPETKISSSLCSSFDSKPLSNVQNSQTFNLKTEPKPEHVHLTPGEQSGHETPKKPKDRNHDDDGDGDAINSSIVSSSDEPDGVTSRGTVASDDSSRPIKGEPSVTSESDDVSNFRVWCEPILTSVLRHLFQRALTEASAENLALIEQIWVQTLFHCSLTAVLVAACPLVAGWLSLAATPSTAPLDPALLLLLLPPVQGNKQNNDHPPTTAALDSPDAPDRPAGCGATEIGKQRSVQYVGGGQHCKKGAVIASRNCAAKLLGELSLYVSRPMPGAVYRPGEDPLACCTALLLTQLRSQSALQRTTAASVVRQWALCYSDSVAVTVAPVNGDSYSSKRTGLKVLEESGLDGLRSSSLPAEKVAMPSRRYLALAEDVPSCSSPSPLVGRRTSCNDTSNSNAARGAAGARRGSGCAATMVDGGPSGVVSSSCNPAMHELFTVLLSCLTHPVYYDEIAVSFTRLQQDTKDFLSSAKHYGLEVDNSLIAAPVLTLDQISEALQGQWLLQQLAGSKLRVKLRNTLEIRRCSLLNSLRSTSATQELLTLSTRGAVAGAVVRLGRLPSKLNPVVKPLIDSIKQEENKHLQSEAGRDLTALLELCSLREKSPNAKVLKNLAAFLCVDPRHTPILMQNSGDALPRADKYSGIYFLRIVNESSNEGPESYQPIPAATAASTTSLETAPGPAKRKRGRPPSKAREQPHVAALPCSILQHNTNHQELHKLSIQRRGCSAALQHLVKHFGARLPTLLPALWDLICQPLLNSQTSPSAAPASSDGLQIGPTATAVGSKGVTSNDGSSEVRNPSPDSATNTSSLSTSSYSVANLLAPQSTKETNDSTKASANSDSQSSFRSQNSVNEGQAVVGDFGTPDGGPAPLPAAYGAEDDAKSQELVNWLQLLETVLPVLHSSLLEKVCQHLPSLEQRLYHSYCNVRHMTARVLGSLATVHTESVMGFLIERLLPSLADITSVTRRQGAVECLHLLVERMGFNVLPYVVLLIVPLLGSSSDSDGSVRAAGSQVFASLIRLLPLDGFMPDPPHLPPSIARQRDKHRDFLHQLMDGNKAHHYTLPVTINATLREYQQAGVNWLAFLRDYGVHGILCDDMGLGKTLQTLCILAATHQEYGHGKESIRKQRPMLQSLVICPPTLTGHWVYEVEHFVPDGLLRPLHYQGSPAERLKLRDQFSEQNLIVASYDIVRNEADFFADVQWLYIILDEGHVIKNTKTKSYQAIRRLSGRHRLILSGTPIQNNVLELWSLFDFLMPGYLGSERHFNHKYSRPILASRDVKASRAEQEAGVVAMEALHRQALPFMMRRLKEDVLKELPPKISQDYYCELSPLQKMLYEDFLESQGSSLDDEQAPKAHVFQALQYLRLVCNHPALVLRPQHPRYNALLSRAGISAQQLHNIAFAAKLPALKELLLECGIGGGVGAGGGGGETLVAPHRALVFCQFRTMIDIIENDLLRVHMPSVTYLRLDGSVPAGQRYGLVQRFNQDPSIDLMLLTTQVGGLGLNLTAADTVIFVEHDWNPMKDLQAMDRAHRIGQKRVVNVYRLITRHTLEEKIMGLQKLKLLTANTVISHDNASLNSMGTEQILDLFSLENDKSGKKGKSGGGLGAEGGCSAPRAVLDGLPELWDQAQYHDEYDLDKFVASFGR